MVGLEDSTHPTANPLWVSTMNDVKLGHPGLDRLVAFGQGRLSETELADLSSHLGDCSECRGKVEASGDDTLISLLRAASTEHEQDQRAIPTLAPAVEPARTLDLPAERSEEHTSELQS